MCVCVCVCVCVLTKVLGMVTNDWDPSKFQCDWLWDFSNQAYTPSLSIVVWQLVFVPFTEFYDFVVGMDNVLTAVINEHRLTRSKRMSSYSHSPSPLVWKTRKQHNVRWWGWALLDHSGRERFKSYASHLTTLAKFVIQRAHPSPWQDPLLTWITTCNCPLLVRQEATPPPSTHTHTPLPCPISSTQVFFIWRLNIPWS